MAKAEGASLFFLIGSLGNILLLTGTIISSSILFFKLPNKASFDKSWLKVGFCVSNPDTKWDNSHAWSFYVDCFFSLILAYIYCKYGRGKDKKLSTFCASMIFGNIFGTLGHGIGHLLLSRYPHGLDLLWHSDAPLKSIFNQIILFITFTSLSNGAQPSASKKTVLIVGVSMCALYNVCQVPPTLTFTYTQACIYILSASWNLFFLDTKHKENMLFMLTNMTQLPVLVIGLMEAFACESFLKALGGHAWYDGAIAFSLVFCSSLEIRTNGAKKIKK